MILSFVPTERACGEQMAAIRLSLAPEDGALPTLSLEEAQTNVAVGSCPVTAEAIPHSLPGTSCFGVFWAERLVSQVGDLK